MENCVTSYLDVKGSTFFRYVNDQKFNKIKSYIISKTKSLTNENFEENFRKGCRELANYLIQNKTAPSYYNKDIWEGVLKGWVKHHYEKLNKHGGCPVIMAEKDLALLNFKYEKGHIISTCNTAPSHFPTKQCNILEPTIFKTLPECKIMHLIEPLPSESKEETNDVQEKNQNTVSVPSTDENPIKENVQNSPVDKTQSEQRTTVDQDVQRVSHSEFQEPLSTGLSHKPQNTREAHDSQTEQDANSKTPSQLETKSPISPSSDTLQHLVSQAPGATDSVETSSSYSEALVPSSSSVKYNGHPKLRVPSFSSNKSELFTDDRLEQPIYDDEEIIKKIKINELTKNVYLSKRKKDRSRTIIEVHMEVLEECRNEEWEKNKEEFFKICIDEFTKKEYNAYPNLTEDDLIIEIIKCSNDITKQNILWNKWIERHRNISEKLKKVHWINNLKNEWKKELAYIQEMEVLKIKSSNENQKVLFLEREKDIWKQWISKKGPTIEQYLEQDLYKELEADLNKMSECVNEDTKNYVSLINVEELQYNENYEELCKYIKKKLLTKLCILTLMIVLEECKKEVNFENRESYLDSSINESKMEEYSDKKQEIIENTIEYNSNNLENTRNEEFHTHIGNDSFRNEIVDWIREDDLYANSVVYNGTIEKSDEIV
ncbi:STP1 protein [Plasmodium malariae]|uniref:STP1 protein n=1 Tax=Plasmodium malariae TaxID=5858 RepID=A0A1A8WWD6_PLAMA|nr:STP1 protein [Plasmodium malariae]